MDISGELFRRIVLDLGLDRPFSRDRVYPVHNCWHFSTDGTVLDEMFLDDVDFIVGMNRIHIVLAKFNVVILAFCLMDTHIHFILYGKYEECNRFVNEYVRRTSIYLSNKYGEKNKLAGTPVSYQPVDDDDYLKIVISYTFRNPTAAAMPYLPYDYPWSSCSLMFRKCGRWTAPVWSLGLRFENLSESSLNSRKKMMKSRENYNTDVKVIDGIIFPDEYVAVQIAEMIFKTHKCFSFFMGLSKENEVDARGGKLSTLSIPMQEMRLHRNELLEEMFPNQSIRNLNVSQRLKLAKTLRLKYNSSIKQITRLCGLVYEEAKDLI